MEERIEETFAFLGDLGTIEIRLIQSAAVILILVVLRGLLVLLVRSQTKDARLRYHWRKGITYTLAFIGLFVIGRVWFVGFRSIATFLGLVAAGLVLALKEPVLNMAAWLFMIWRRPFAVGDRIEISGHAGDVIDQRLFQFSILEIGNWIGSDQSTGRVIHIPNGRLFQDPLANYTRGFPYLWNELSVTLTFESNWRAAKEMLEAAAERHGRVVSAEAEDDVLAESRRFMIFYSTLAPTVYTRIDERGVVLTIRYLCEVRRRRDTEHAIWEDLLDALGARDDIDIAYPTQRFFDRGTETRTLQPRVHEPGDGLIL